MAINLKNVDITVLVDKSGSMNSQDCGGQTRWAYSWEVIADIVRTIAAQDEDGIGIGVFSNKGQFQFSENRGPNDIEALRNLTPGGFTYLGEALSKLLPTLIQRSSDKPQLVLIITDGEPSDKPEVASAIIDATRRMTNDGQLAILFAQVGPDKNAEAYLTSLDDNLTKQGAKYDIVDYKEIEDVAGMGAEQMVEAAFNG